MLGGRPRTLAPLILRALAELGPAPLSQLALKLGRSKRTIRGSIELLRRDGLVGREECPLVYDGLEHAHVGSMFVYFLTREGRGSSGVSAPTGEVRPRPEPLRIPSWRFALWGHQARPTHDAMRKAWSPFKERRERRRDAREPGASRY